jgi:hypothetical protein
MLNRTTALIFFFFLTSFEFVYGIPEILIHNFTTNYTVEHGKTGLIASFSLFGNVTNTTTIFNQTTNQTENLTQIIPVQNVNFQFLNFPFQASAVPSNLSTLVNSSVNISVNATIPPFTTTGIYKGILLITSSNAPSKSLEISVFVPENKSYAISNLTQIKQAPAGFSGVFGNFSINNTGNKDLLFTFSISGNASPLLEIQKQKFVLKGTKEDILISYDIPKTQSLGVYEGNITIKENNNEKNISFSLEVNDVLPPEILNAEFENSSLQATLNYSLIVEVEDNVKVSDVLVKFIFTDKKTGETINLGEFNFTKSAEKNKWILEKAFNNIGDYQAYITALDSSGNKATKLFLFKVVELDSLNHSEAVKLPKRRVNTFSSADAFTITNSTPIEIKLQDVVYSGNYTIYLEKPDGSQLFFKSVNETLNIFDAGVWKIGVKGDKPEEFFAKFVFSVIPQHKPVKNLTISATFVNYSIPEPGTFYYPFGTLERSIIDTGVPSTSFVSICTKIPLENYSEQREVCVAKTSIDTLKKEIDKKEEIFAKSKNLYTGIVIFLLLALVVIAVKMLWNENVMPYYVGLRG